MSTASWPALERPRESSVPPPFSPRAVGKKVGALTCHEECQLGRAHACHTYFQSPARRGLEAVFKTFLVWLWPRKLSSSVSVTLKRLLP